MKTLNRYRLALVSTGIVGFGINMVQVWYHPFEIDILLLSYIVALGVTIVTVVNSFNKEKWMVGILSVSILLITMIIPVVIVLSNQPLIAWTKLMSYISWWSIPLMTVAMGFVSRGDNY